MADEVTFSMPPFPLDAVEYPNTTTYFSHSSENTVPSYLLPVCLLLAQIMWNKLISKWVSVNEEDLENEFGKDLQTKATRGRSCECNY